MSDVRADAWRPIALNRANGGYDAGILSQDDDGVMRFYVDCLNPCATVEKAMDKAKAAKSGETYRDWSDCYKLTGGNWKPK